MRKGQNVQDKYDVEDPFIDDSEALMEQVAAESKDGLFVYSGPLIAEGERAKIDKFDGRWSNRRRERRRQRNLWERKFRGQRRGRRRARVNRLSLESMKSQR